MSVIISPFYFLYRGGTHSVGCVFGADTGSVEQESDRGHLLALALTEGIHQLLQLSRSLDLEEDLIVVVGNLDVQVLNGRGAALLLSGHCEDKRRIV